MGRRKEPRAFAGAAGAWFGGALVWLLLALPAAPAEAADRVTKPGPVRLWVVRHGYSLAQRDFTVCAFWRGKDRILDRHIHLAPEGWQQSRKAGPILADLLGSHGVEAGKSRVLLWHSPFVRTIETKDGMLQGGLAPYITEVRPHKGLREIDFGVIAGLDYQAWSGVPRLKASYLAHKAARESKDPNAIFTFRFPGRTGDSQQMVFERNRAFLGEVKEVAAAEGVRDHVVVTHGNAGRALAIAAMGLDPAPAWREEISPANCAIRLLVDNVDKGYLFEGFKMADTRRPEPTKESKGD
jgi:2,3-bisphosphoglycerate-dependent phosphoglycerate mutase